MRLTAEGPAARPVWTRVLAQDPVATVSQTPAWMDCLCASGRWEDVTRAYLADDGRELVLPLARRRRPGDALPVEGSMPFGWGTGGLVCPDGRLSAADVAAVAADLCRRRPVRATLRPGPAMEKPWTAGVPAQAVRTRHMSQSIDLAGGFEELWSSGFSSSVRRNTRKAERAEIAIDWESGAALVPVFDALYRASVDRWAERQHEPRALAQWRARRRDPRSKFDVVAERLGPACRIGVAWLAGAPAAAIVVLSHGDHSTYWRGAMDQALAARTGANELLHRTAIEEACEAGRRWYHMGDSAPSSSLAEFKRRFGAREEHYTGYRLERWPLSAAEDSVRRAVKRLLRFRD
jgi:GNAT acetyltransferase-like protein